MAENVSGEIKLRMITEGDEKAAEGVEGKVQGKVSPKKDPELTGMAKWMASIGKTMKKINPVFDTSSIIIYLIRKSAVIWGLVEPLIDILAAIIDTLLMPLVPLLAPVLRIIASSIPAIQMVMTVITGILEPISGTLDWLADIVQDGAAIIKGWKISPESFNPLNDKSIWAGMSNAVSSSLSSVLGSIPGIGGLFAAPKASGIAYVPQTMTAELHRGETVLTARETQQRNAAGGGVNIMNPQFVVNAGGSTTMDAKVFAQQLYAEFSKKLTSETRRV